MNHLISFLSVSSFILFLSPIQFNLTNPKIQNYFSSNRNAFQRTHGPGQHCGNGGDWGMAGGERGLRGDKRWWEKIKYVLKCFPCSGPIIWIITKFVLYNSIYIGLHINIRYTFLIYLKSVEEPKILVLWEF